MFALVFMYTATERKDPKYSGMVYCEKQSIVMRIR